MSSGIEILVLAPFLFPALAGGAATTGAATTGAVVVSGSSVVTTSAFATGSVAGSAAGSSALATGAALAGGAVLVVGAAGAALLAAHHLQGSYDAALCAYQRRLEDEKAPVYAANQRNQEAMSASLLRARKTRVRAAESADLAFLRAGVKKMQKQVGDGPDVDPHLPGACAHLATALEQPSPNLAELFRDYESLGTRVAAWTAKRREKTLKALATSTPSAAALESLRGEVEAEIAAMREEVTLAPPAILSDKVREGLKRSLGQVEALAAAQPRLAEQSLQLLRGRVGRELALGAAQEAKRRAAQEKDSARLRELAGRISARSQATLSVLEDKELAESPLAQARIGQVQAKAMAHLERLAALLANESSGAIAPLEKLAAEADALFEDTAEQLRQVAVQIYLESQVAEVFTQLGYRVSSVGDPAAGDAGVVATLDSGHGVEVRLDGKGNLHSEMVAFSPSATEIEPHAQEKVCALMDEVFDGLRSRGCGIKEKKRRHFKRGERSLRVVKPAAKKVAPAASATSPAARRLDG